MHATGATPVPDASGFVTCAKHDTRRKVLYCVLKPIYDADLTVVSHQYECKEGQTCTSRRAAAVRPPTSSLLVDANGEKRMEASPMMEVIDCGSSRMLEGEGKGWERTKNGGLSSTTAAASGRDTGAFSILFTKKAANSDANDSGDHGAPVEGGVSSDGMSGEDEGGKICSEEVVKGDLQNPPETNAAVSLSSEPLRQTLTPRTAPLSRYFDLQLNNGGGGGSGGIFPAKVCWNCGLPDHEKPNCPNMLCRNCHGIRGTMNTQHFCEEVRVASPFIMLPRSVAELPQGANGMPTVRCVRCHELGHFDCGNNTNKSNTNSNKFTVDDSSLSCCYCGGKGHTGYDCRKRQRAHPDRWVQRHLAAAAREESGKGGGNYNSCNNNASFHHRSSYPRGSPASHPQSFSCENYQRNVRDGASYSCHHSHYSDMGPSNVYRSPYNHRSTKGHDGHRARDAYYEQDGGDSRRFRQSEVTASYRNAAHNKEEDRYERHSRRHRAEGGAHPHHRGSGSDGDDWRSGRQEDYRHRPRGSRGGGRRGYSGFSSEDDLY
ncbi:unnamed protein product [Phytomonas sp. Hart1]|nr:unnamed protein product [Phytomonas sp. Hart1]|eukprot:CCW68335.1 unnamed protein product [Phytomonas sp. isolate Hart1]